MRLAITCNGPGETAGWLRPLLLALYGRSPEAQVHVFYVPDDFATGDEPRYVREHFPQAHVYEPAVFVKAVLGARIAELPSEVDAVLYLGGDVTHAARLRKRLGGSLCWYKFCSRRSAAASARAFAVDDENANDLAGRGIPKTHVQVVGNLAIDGALAQAAEESEPQVPAGGVLIMPGSRSYEVEHLVPLFFTAALHMRRQAPDLPIAFGISPFTSIDALAAAVEAGGDPRVFARRGKLETREGQVQLRSLEGSEAFPVLRNALAAARRARLILTIPGTKVIEAAALGIPILSCTPLNAPEMAAINGPLTYLDRLPFVGTALKRAVVTRYSRRFRFHTQPNIDAQAEIVRELHGTLTPGRIARVTLDSLADAAWLERSALVLEGLYRKHAGAADRMVSGILSLRHTVA